jgi:hypothetical protein
MSVVVLLYSKYSKGCDKVLEMMSGMDFRKICIDHDQVRKLVVQNQKKYNIEKVPCILVFFANGVMKKYEGADAFEWVRDTMEKMRYIQERQAPLAPSPAPSPLPSSVPNHPVEITEMPSRPAPKSTDSPRPLLEPLFTLPSKERIAVQTVEEDVVPDMRRAMDSAPLPIQKSLPKEEPSEGNHGGGNNNPMRGIKSDKQESIMSVAQQMQKQREKEEEVRNPNTA